MSHKPGGRLPLLFARSAVTLATLNQFLCLVNRGMMGVKTEKFAQVCYPTASRL